MLTRIERQTIFFIIAFCLYYLSTNLSKHVSKDNIIKPYITFIFAFTFTLILIGTYYTAKLNITSENFWDISEYAKCKGGPYMWQGDSPEAQKCRELSSTEQGSCGIASYNCPSGYIGTPLLPFNYTSLSNDQWKNERCENRDKCPCKDTGLCGMGKQVE